MVPAMDLSLGPCVNVGVGLCVGAEMGYENEINVSTALGVSLGLPGSIGYVPV